MMDQVHVLANADALSRAAGDYLVARTQSLLHDQEHVSIVLAGGSTPRRLYHLLASDNPLPWHRVHLFLGDERYVPADDPESNEGMIRHALLDAVEVPADNLHFFDTNLPTPADSARAYEDGLLRFFDGPPSFDILLLGMGSDGHTLSLFPGTADASTNRLAMAAKAPASYPTRERVTLTLQAANAARDAVFLVSGADKAEAFARVRPDSPERASLPAGWIRPREQLHWFVDEAAAGSGAPRPGNGA